MNMTVATTCPKGFWMTEEDAVKRLRITPKVWRLYKKEACPTNIHFEHGKRAAPMPYKKFQFVFISPDDGTTASQNYGEITLLNWCRMCDYFSKNLNTTDDDGDKQLRRLVYI